MAHQLETGNCPEFNLARSPSWFQARQIGRPPDGAERVEYENWFFRQAQEISDAMDRAGTPWLQMFDIAGGRLDQICYPPEYWSMLHHRYRAGVVWRAFAEQSLLSAFSLLYLTSFFNPGLACPYTVPLATAGRQKNMGR
jgi:acyl-CoA dehydrogenase